MVNCGSKWNQSYRLEFVVAVIGERKVIYI